MQHVKNILWTPEVMLTPEKLRQNAGMVVCLGKSSVIKTAPSVPR